MRVFVPVEDAPVGSGIPMLIPYRCGLACAHELRETDDWRPRGFQSHVNEIESKRAERTNRDPESVFDSRSAEPAKPILPHDARLHG